MNRLEKLQAMVSEDPEDPFLHYAIAKELISQGQSTDGLERLEEMNSKWPDYVAAYFQRGQTLAEVGQTDSAREVIVAGIQAAERVDDEHAQMEMRGFLDMLNS